MDEAAFKARYSVFHDFLDTVFWPKEDGPNLIVLLHRVVVRAHPDRARRLIEEMRAMGTDDELASEDLSELILEGAGSPYRLAGSDASKDLVYCLAEFLEYVLEESGGEVA